MLAAVKKRLPEVNVDIVTIIRNPNLRAFAAEIDRFVIYSVVSGSFY